MVCAFRNKRTRPDIRAVAGQGFHPDRRTGSRPCGQRPQRALYICPGASAWAGVNNLTNNTYIASIRPAGWNRNARTFYNWSQNTLDQMKVIMAKYLGKGVFNFLLTNK